MSKADKGRSPAFQFYPKDWLSSESVRLMTPTERGAYIDLLAMAWLSSDCGLPDRDEALAVLSGLGKDWEQSKERILACFIHKEGRIYNQRLMQELEKQRGFIKKQKRAAASRWQSHGTAKAGNALAIPRECFAVSSSHIAHSSDNTPISPAVEPWEIAAELSTKAWEAKHGTSPDWTGEYGMIGQKFADNPALTVEMWMGRWNNYLASSPEFGREGHTLKHFLKYFDRFVDGPLGGNHGSNQGTVPENQTRIAPSLAALREYAKEHGVEPATPGLVGECYPALPEGGRQPIEQGIRRNLRERPKGIERQ